jgi:hypothetical protein
VGLGASSNRGLIGLGELIYPFIEHHLVLAAGLDQVCDEGDGYQILAGASTTEDCGGGEERFGRRDSVDAYYESCGVGA